MNPFSYMWIIFITLAAFSQYQMQRLIMKQRRRAQNRASQQAYRDRKDCWMKELEMQVKETGDQNESLKRDHAKLCAAHEKLKGEQARWREGKEALENNEAEL